MQIKVLTNDGCNPCKMVKQFLDSKNVSYQEINVSDEPQVVQQYGIMSTPVTVLEEDGKELGRVPGFNPPSLQKLIDQL